MQESVKPKLGFGILKAKIKKMNRNKYAELLDTVSRQSENISKSIFTKKINHDAHRLAIDCLRLLLTEAELLLKEETAKDLPCTCENQKLGQTTCDKTCVDADEYS